MQIGGISKYVIEIHTKDDIVKAFNFVREKNLPFYFLGAGANTFGTDEGFSGAIILNKILGITEIPDGEFNVSGGEKWDDFVSFIVEPGYSGVECLAGIPGTVRAAPVQNIGAYGQEVKDTILSVEVFDFKTGKFKTLEKAECDFSYRHSIFNSNERGRYFILSVNFKLKKGEVEGELYNSLQRYLDENGISSRDPKIIAEAVRKIRDSKLPKPEEEASSGSFFKNVYVSEDKVAELDERGIPHHGTKVNTGWLIENAGLKGKDFYGFKVSDKAALVLINESATSYSDLEKAVEEISKAVEEKFGFSLEQEPNVIGLEQK